MSEVNAGPRIGPALAFYARFAGEVDVLWKNPERDDDAIYREHFQPRDRTDFNALLNRTDRLCDVIESDSRSITQTFEKEVNSPEWLSAAAVIRLKQYKKACAWESAFYVRPRDARKRKPRGIMIGLSIWTREGVAYLSTWIWVDGVDRSSIASMISRSSRRFKKPTEYAGLSEPNYLYFAHEKLLTLAEKGEAVSSLASRFFAPFKTISRKAWQDLLDPGK